MTKHNQDDIYRTNSDRIGVDSLVRIALLAAMTFWSFELVKPFFGLLAWGFILAIALYPTFLWLNKRLGHRTILTASVITTVCLLITVSTLSILTNNMVITVATLTRQIHGGAFTIPPPPSSILSWPVIGEELHDLWESASTNLGALVNSYSSFIVHTGRFILTRFAGKTIDLFIFILSMVFSGYLLVQSDEIKIVTRTLAIRLAPTRGPAMVSIINQTIQSVSIGVIGIAIVQSLLLGIVLFLADTPGVGLITFLALLLSISQIGLVPVIIPVILWLFLSHNIVPAAIFSALVMSTGLVDNVLKPFVLTRGLHTPMIVILLGVIGGLFLHGLIGIFIGPVILAVFYDLADNWLQIKSENQS